MTVSHRQWHSHDYRLGGQSLRGEKARERVHISRQAETVQQAQVQRAKDRQRVQICLQAETVKDAQLC